MNKPCKVWQGATTHDGYGIIWKRGKDRGKRVHRVEWERANGPIPDGAMVCHHCDNPPCYELTHLYLGDARSNHDDMVRRGRRRGRDKLSDIDVQEIRRLASDGAMTHTEIARQYGITQPYVGMLLRGINRRGTVEQ